MGKKFRVRMGAARGRQIPKGGSSSSNPTSSRHRDAAKASRMVAHIPMVSVDDQPDTAGPSDYIMGQLPIESMRLNETKQNDTQAPFADVETRSMMSEGGLTNITQFTNCTNPTFDAVHREWKSGSKLHDDVVAVLAAVAEIIQQNSGNETDVEYFGALLAAMESTIIEDSHKIAAVAYLLSLIVRKIAKEVHVKFFGQSSKIIWDKVTQLSNGDNATALKFLIPTMGAILRSQPISAWEIHHNKALLTGIATFAVHDKPAVRTMSRRVLRSILTDPVTSLENGTHPAAKTVGQYILHSLQNASGVNQSTSLTWLLCLLEGIMHKVPETTFKELAEVILKLGATADRMVRCAAFQCAYRVLQRQPSDASLSASTNAQLVHVLREFPVPVDVAVCAYWLQALAEAHVCLAAKEQSRSVDLLGDTLDICGQLFARGDALLGETVHEVIVRLIERCIQQNPSAAVKCLDLLDMSLNIQNTAVWKLILRTMSSLFEEAQTAVLGDVFERTLHTLADLRAKDDCFCATEIEIAFGSAIRCVGVYHVLSVVNLGIDPDAPVLPTDFGRSWLLPVLKNNIQNAPISIFTKYILSMAIKLHRRIPTLPALAGKLYATVENQLWGLLPAFLSSPSDFEESFPTLAPMMGAALNERADLRLTILAAIRSALNFASEPSAPNRGELMARFAKNFLPILFNIYSITPTEEAPKNGIEDTSSKLATLETIRLYIPKTPEELLSAFVKSAIEKIHDENNTLQKKALIMDILISMARGAQIDALFCMFNAIQEWFTSKESSLQKKAYRLLAEIYRRIGDESLHPFFEANREFIVNLIKSEPSAVTPSAWSARIGIYRSILTSLNDYSSLSEFCQIICQHLVLCLDKGNSHIIRAQALKCFQELCGTLLHVGGESGVQPSDSLDLVLNKIYEMTNEVTGNVAKSEATALPIARATLVALNVIAQKYLHLLNACLLSRFIGHASSAVADTRSPIRLLAIRLVRLLCIHLPAYALQQYKELLLNAVFCSQSSTDVTSRVRKANRLLFEILIEKLGRQSLESYASTQEGWVKQLKSVDRAIRRRQSRHSGQKSISDDNDDETVVSSVSAARTTRADSIFQLLEDSDNEETVSRNGNSARSQSVWIKEGENEDPMDLLDNRSIVNRITTVQPQPSRAGGTATDKKALEDRKEIGGFKLTKDGRLLIQDLDSLVPSKSRSKRTDMDVEMNDNVISTNKKNNHSKGDEDSEDDEDMPTTSKYRPGGKGIHRNLASSTKSSKSDHKKKGDKFEPYAYIPLRQKKGQQKVLKKTIQKTLRNNATRPKNRKAK